MSFLTREKLVWMPLWNLELMTLCWCGELLEGGCGVMSYVFALASSLNFSFFGVRM